MGKQRWSVLYLFLFLVSALGVSGSLAWGQAGLASVSGTVHDPSGAAVPGVTVTITNKNTGVHYSGQSNSAGVYYIGALPIGTYTLSAEKQGFDRWQRDVELEVGQHAVIDFAMQVGSVTTVVQVTGATPILNTTGTEVGDVKDYQRINQLPLNGRSIATLFNLTPGVEGGGNARVNGMKVGSMGISLDGISERDRFGGGIVREQPDIQDIQEFAIDTSGSDARYANPSTVILKSRSGTNQLHGELFEYNRNNTGGLLARLRQQPAGTPFPKDNRNEFGGDIGGPVILPHIYNGHDKTFFFFSYEGRREVGRANNNPESGLGSTGNIVPTQAMWNGDLSNAIDASDGQPILLYNPYSTDPTTGERQRFLCTGGGSPLPVNTNGTQTTIPGSTPCNIIPPSMISPIAKELAAITQRPNLDTNPFLADNITYVYPTLDAENKTTAKVDENFSEKDRLSVRWTRDTLLSTQGGGAFGNPVSPSDGFGTERENSSVTNVSVDYTHTISNSALNQLIIGVLRTPTSSGTLADFTDWAQKLGLPNPFGVTGWPTICAGCDYCWDADNRKDEHLTTETVEDNVTWVKGRHTIEFGGAFHREQNNVRELQQAQGSHDFGAGWTCNFDPVAQACQADTGDAFATTLLGIPDFLSNQYNRGYYYFRQSYFSAYFNDRWRVTPRLTLNFGLRWDKWTPYSEAENRIDTAPLNTLTHSFLVITPDSHGIQTLPGIPPSVLDSWAARGLQYSTANAVGYPSALFAAPNRDLGPRVGAAFKINNKTVLRGGYGIFYFPMPLSQILQTSRTNPPLNLRFANNFFGSGTCGYGSNFNYVISSAPSPDNLLPNATVCTNGIVQISPSARSIFPYDGPNWKDSRFQNWNFTLERVLPGQTILRLSYIGNHGDQLAQRVSLNNRLPQITYAETTGLAPPSNKDLLRPNPNWSLANGYAAHNGFSNSDSVQVNVEHKYRNGAVVQFFYVYDHGLTTTDTGGSSSGNAAINSGGGGGRIPEVSDILGEPSLTEQQLASLVYFNMTTIPIQHYGWNGLVDLPFGAGKKFLGSAHGPLNQLVGGWQVAWIGNWTSGFWQSVNTGLVTAGNPRINSGQRLTLNYAGAQQELWFAGDINPALASNISGGGLTALENLIAKGGVRPFGPNCKGAFNGTIAVQLANEKCFNAPSGDFYNASARGSIIGPSVFSMDASIYKNFNIKERAKLRFEADFFNVFNHPTDTNLSATTGLLNLGVQTNQPRLIQFALHLFF